MRLLVATAAVGDEARALLAVSGPLLKRYADRIGADFRALTNPASVGSDPRAVKFHLGKAFTQGGYDRLIFLDVDLLPRADCPSLFDVVPASHVGMFDDLPDQSRPDHQGTNGPMWLARQFGELLKSQGWVKDRRNWPLGKDWKGCLNSGVIVASRQHAGLFDPPAKPYPNKYLSEQHLISLNRLRHGYPLYRLPEACNYQQWSHPDGFDWADQPIIHLAGIRGEAKLPALKRLAWRLYPDTRPQVGPVRLKPHAAPAASRKAVATLAIGRVGRELLAVTGPAMRAYADRIGADFVVIEDETISPGWPHGAKWQVRRLLDAYGRVLYLDGDVLVAPDCPDLFLDTPESHFAAYDESADLRVLAERTASTPDWVWREMADVCAATRLPVPEKGPYYNAGIYLASRCHRDLLTPPAGPLPFFHCAEQHYLNARLRQLGTPVHRLPAACNWSWWYARLGTTDWATTPAHLYHAAGADPLGGGGPLDHAGRLKLLRQVADRLYPDRGRCAHRSLNPIQRAGGCCGADAGLIAASHEYDCDRHDARCCEGFGLLSVSVRRCRTCPDFVGETPDKFNRAISPVDAKTPFSALRIVRG